MADGDNPLIRHPSKSDSAGAIPAGSTHKTRISDE
jgi:hypothetical protein